MPGSGKVMSACRLIPSRVDLDSPERRRLVGRSRVSAIMMRPFRGAAGEKRLSIYGDSLRPGPRPQRQAAQSHPRRGHAKARRSGQRRVGARKAVDKTRHPRRRRRIGRCPVARRSIVSMASRADGGPAGSRLALSRHREAARSGLYADGTTPNPRTTKQPPINMVAPTPLRARGWFPLPIGEVFEEPPERCVHPLTRRRGRSLSFRRFCASRAESRNDFKVSLQRRAGSPPSRGKRRGEKPAGAGDNAARSAPPPTPRS